MSDAVSYTEKLNGLRRFAKEDDSLAELRAKTGQKFEAAESAAARVTSRKKSVKVDALGSDNKRRRV